MDFIKWYKTKVDQNDLMPPENVWEGIQNELDIDQSWYVINKHLNNESVVRRRKIYALAASLLIFISTGIFFSHNALELKEDVDLTSHFYNIIVNIKHHHECSSEIARMYVKCQNPKYENGF